MLFSIHIAKNLTIMKNKLIPILAMPAQQTTTTETTRLFGG
ncbi:hypothetical protein XIS1_310013 [Xenorhabdus innexi]|uniref:Uncharacterized protein n=1 Tax=Xenorhabdus innexi TaxID=290109 RepID=A0A1N6MXE4_9GAMM|nr:hypothetical protein XIS1_310013 [Xenorhabdus innexi]